MLCKNVEYKCISKLEKNKQGFFKTKDIEREINETLEQYPERKLYGVEEIDGEVFVIISSKE